MRIQVENARKEEGKKFSFSFIQPVYHLGDVGDLPWKDSDVSVDGEYWFDGSHLIVAGTIRTIGTYPCSRCLKPVTVEREALLAETYGTERELPEDVFYYNGEYVDLTESVRELLIASEPMKVLCRTDCAGLCPQCGSDLNEGICSCLADNIDPRLAVLGELLNRKY